MPPPDPSPSRGAPKGKVPPAPKAPEIFLVLFCVGKIFEGFGEIMLPKVPPKVPPRTPLPLPQGVPQGVGACLWGNPPPPPVLKTSLEGLAGEAREACRAPGL